MKHHRVYIGVLLLLVVLIAGCSTPLAADQAKSGSKVQISYTGKLSDGTVFDSTTAENPFEFILGNNEVIPGFEKAVTGMRAGEKKTVTIPAAEAYGPYRDDLTTIVNRDKLPQTVKVQVGEKLYAKKGDGTMITATIAKVTETTVTLDANNPLAGKDLTFELELIKIE